MDIAKRTKIKISISVDKNVGDYQQHLKNSGCNFSKLVNDLLKKSHGFKEYQKLEKEKDE